MEAIKMIPAIVLALVIAGLVVGAGVKVLSSFRSDAVKSIANVVVTNESQTASGVVITPNATAAGSILTSVDQVWVSNISDGTGYYWRVTENAGWNASVGINGVGTILIQDNYSGNRTWVWYTHQPRDDVLNATIDSLKGTTEISGQFSTIGIVVAMIVILMMIGGLATYFAMR